MTFFKPQAVTKVGYTNGNNGSLAVNQSRSLNFRFLSKENSSWAQTTTSQQQKASKK